MAVFGARKKQEYADHFWISLFCLDADHYLMEYIMEIKDLHYDFYCVIF
jgi:hypothetical protein